MKAQEKQKIIQRVGAKAVVEVLDPYVTDARKGRIETVLNGRLNGIQLAIEAPSDINNALAAVRSSEALGISTVHIICPEGDARYARGITQGAIYWVEVKFYESLASFLDWATEEQMKLVGGTVTATTALADVPVTNPICIFLGNEKRGLSSEAVNACAIEYKIPMYGMTESFNLSVSAAISLYDTCNRRRALIGSDTDLTAIQRLGFQATYYLNSVEARLALALLKSF